MSKYKYITGSLEDINKLSSTAASLVLPLIIQADDVNMINKKQFIKRVGFNYDPRTWRKYWIELEVTGLIRKFDKNTWMLSPYQCYSEGVSRTAMITKWNGVKHAIS